MNFEELLNDHIVAGIFQAQQSGAGLVGKKTANTGRLVDQYLAKQKEVVHASF